MIRVKKRDGRSEMFQLEKVQVSVINAGGSADEAKLVVQNIDGLAYDGITTHEIASHVHRLLRHTNPDIAKNYAHYSRDLKRSQRSKRLEDRD